MSDYDDLLAAILHKPLDDAPRLILADWLDENGRPGQGRFIRAQVNAPDRDAFTMGSVRTKTGLWHKMVDLEPWTIVQDRVTVPAVVTVGNSGKTKVQFRRGFADRVWVPAGMFMCRAEEVFCKHPITRVRLTKPFWNDVAGGTKWRWTWEVIGLLGRITKANPDGPKLRDGHLSSYIADKAVAEAALSDVLVSYGRGVAGLGPL